jgi:hypothetical protein
MLHRSGGLWFIVRYTDLVDQYRRKDLLFLKREGSYGWLSNSERSRASIHVCCAPSSFLPAATSGQEKTEGPDAGFCFYRRHLNCEELHITSFSLLFIKTFRQGLLQTAFFFFTGSPGSFLCHLSDQKLSFYLIDQKLSSFLTYQPEAFSFIYPPLQSWLFAVTSCICSLLLAAGFVRSPGLHRTGFLESFSI